MSLGLDARSSAVRWEGIADIQIQSKNGLENHTKLQAKKWLFQRVSYLQQSGVSN